MEFIIGATATATGVFAAAAVGAISEIRKSNKKLNTISATQPVLRYAQVPKILKHAEGWKVDEKNQVGFTLGKDNKQFATAESIVFMQDFLSKRHSKSQIVVPKNALSVSFVTENFQIGKSAQEFIPIDHSMPDDSFFSYQMLSTQSQATFYNEDGQAYLAGICYYLTPKGQMDYHMFCDDQKMRLTLLLAEHFPKQDRMQTNSFKNYKIYSRDCKTAGKRVVIMVDNDGKPLHYGFDFKIRQKKYECCEECAEEFLGYRFVPKVVPEVEEPKVEEPKKPEEPKVEEKKEESESMTVDKKDREGQEDFDFCDELDIMIVE